MEFVRTTLDDTVHSGTPRTAVDDDETNFCPVRLNEQTLRSGTIYAAPFGHVFKRFRPVVVEQGILRSLTNQEITAHPDYGDWGLEQYEHGVEGFYDLVDDVLSPAPLDPKRALLEMIDALEEQATMLERPLREEPGKRCFDYIRSDETSFGLSLGVVVKRAEAFDVAYNPNDCPEVRSGAAEGSDEAAPCKLHAPWKQALRMRKTRKWFK